MKTEYRILIVTGVLGIVVWIVDAIVDYVAYGDRTFLQMLVSDVPAFEVYLRSLILGLLLVFGLIMALVTAKGRRAEEALAESEERFRSLAESASDAIISIDQDARIIYWNDAATTIFGHSAEEAIGQPLTIIMPEHRRAGFCEDFRYMMSQETPNRTRTATELIGFRKDGTEFPAEVSYGHWQTKEGAFSSAIVRDISERKAFGEQLKHSQLLASLGRMTAGIAHEVNNPLGSILLYSELLLEGEDPSQSRKDLKIIHGEALRAKRIMRDLLTYSRPAAHQRRRLDLPKIIGKVLEMRQYWQSVQNVTVTTNFPSDPLFVKGNSSQLSQLFMNLILNAEEAVKPSKGGHITIDARCHGSWARVSISDDGRGIPQKNLGQVFEPFFTTKSVGEGTGLGLSTCYGIVAGHDGHILVENNQQGGASFIIELPLAEIKEQLDTPRQEKEASLTPTLK